MRTLFHLFITGLFFVLLPDNAIGKSEETIIKITSSGSANLNLMQTVDGQLINLSRASKDENGNISFELSPEASGFYAISGKDIAQKIIYVKNGDHISLTEREGKLLLSGKKSKENVVLETWQEMTEGIRKISIIPVQRRVRYEDFFSIYRKVDEQTDKFLNSIKTGNKESNNLLKSYITYEKGLFPLSYAFLPIRVGNPVVYDAYASEYAKLFSPDQFADATILKMPFGMDYLMRYTHIASSISKQSGEDRDVLLSFVKDPTVKGALLLSTCQGVKTYIEAEQLFEKYRDLLNEPQREAFLKILDRLDKQRIRTDFVDFSYPDVDGKRYSAADFKGKVILLDFWATWCQPCIAEIPHLKELKAYFKDKDIVFIGISVDRTRDKGKWQDFLKANELPGYQLFSEAGEGETIKHYQLNSIPRFMIIGKDGKLTAPNAPKPSNPILKQLLEEELGK